MKIGTNQLQGVEWMAVQSRLARFVIGGRHGAGLMLAALVVAGCGQSAGQAPDSADSPPGSQFASGEHAHAAGAHGGFIVPIGKDHHHAEAVFLENGNISLYLLGHDESQVLETQLQSLDCYARPVDSQDSVLFSLKADPQPSDANGRTSRFSGTLPDELTGRELYCLVPSIRIGEARFRFSFTSPQQPRMPSKVVDDEEQQLYLTPGGKYTEADIAANGRVTASQRYADFHSAHDFDPQPGDALCPVTRTKAHPDCSWTIDGKTYLFCCPPCIDELVRLAKEEPEKLQGPDQFIQQ